MSDFESDSVMVVDVGVTEPDLCLKESNDVGVVEHTCPYTPVDCERVSTAFS